MRVGKKRGGGGVVVLAAEGVDQPHHPHEKKGKKTKFSSR